MCNNTIGFYNILKNSNYLCAMLTLITLSTLCANTALSKRSEFNYIEEDKPIRWEDFGQIQNEDTNSFQDFEEPVPFRLDQLPERPSSNPITVFGVTISEFLEYGMVPVLDLDSMLSQTSGEVSGGQNVYIKRIYKPKRFPGSKSSSSVEFIDVGMVEEQGDEQDTSDDENDKELN